MRRHITKTQISDGIILFEPDFNLLVFILWVWETDILCAPSMRQDTVEWQCIMNVFLLFFHFQI